ncbi:Uu.00g057310.m01.CDS01 [Anthostomella pinea]|uniref:Uu.00g057310.m01.CDS01 n=1 Tax=Anthostomella pinea TaxID=933095 RepID=A0AAI8VRQ1_9PEZI|nr:Uu.00g057310.m01.CDS01 [Anthostomella pinea]
MSLLDLPSELLQQIVKETVPEDFEHVGLTCKTLNAAGAVFLDEYRQRRRRFRHFAFSHQEGTDGESQVDAATGATEGDAGSINWDAATKATGFIIRTTRELVEYIARDPIIGRYIQTADLKNSHSDQLADWDHDAHDHVKIDDQVWDLVRESAYVREAGVDPTDMLFHGCAEGYYQVLLMSLLPNTTALAPGRQWSELMDNGIVNSGSMGRFMEVIVRKANSPASTGASLSKLEFVYPWMGSGYEERGSLSSCTPFLALDSLRGLYAGSVIGRDDGYTGYAFEPGYDTYSAKLETIELFASIIGAVELRELLSRTPSLKHFRFAHETKYHGCGWNWDIGASIAVVQDCVGGTLEDLAVTLMGDGLNNSGTTLTDMTGFRKLKMLELDYVMLVGPAYDKERAEADPADNDNEPPWGPPAMVRLVDLLPESIENVNIYVGPGFFTDEKYIQAARKLFDGLNVKSPCARLPHLKEVRYVPKAEPKHPDIAELLDEVKGTGCTVTEKNRAMPKFASSFCERFGVEFM